MTTQVLTPNLQRPPSPAWTAALLFVLAGLGMGLLGVTWLTRASNHDGVELVAVEDRPSVNVTPPRNTLVVLVDGLGLEPALQTPVTAWLREHGRCFQVTHDTPTMSRPIYAVLSTGLPQARTGVRANGVPQPAAARGIWEDMTAAGLTVGVWSDVEWWQELFPKGFTTVRPATNDPAQGVLDTRVSLVHPTLVDHAGHELGGDSHAYAEAVGQSSALTLALLQRLSLSQDLALVTADHGHWGTGGHGGEEPRVARVLACVVGRGVRPGAALAEIPGITVGPLLSALMGLPFPRHMQAPNPGLAVALDALDPAAFPVGWLEDRRAAMARFDAAGTARLEQLHASTWDALRDQGRHRMARQWWLAMAAALLGLALAVRVFGGRHGNRATVWALAVLVVTPVVFWMWRGTFSLSVINTRLVFVVSTSLLCGTLALSALAGLLWWTRSWRAARAGQAGVVAGLAALAVAHVVIHGWTPGVVLPEPALFFAPLWFAVMGGTHAVLGALLCLWSRTPWDD